MRGAWSGREGERGGGEQTRAGAWLVMGRRDRAASTRDRGEEIRLPSAAVPLLSACPSQTRRVQAPRRQ